MLKPDLDPVKVIKFDIGLPELKELGLSQNLYSYLQQLASYITNINTNINFVQNYVMNHINAPMPDHIYLLPGGSMYYGALATAWTDWTPSYGAAGGAMTFTNVTTFVAKYCRLGGIVFFTIHFSGTTGNTPSPYLRFTLPIVGVDSKFGGACRNLDIGNNSRVGVWYNSQINGNNRIVVAHGDSSNWTLGLSRGAVIQGFYRV